MKLKTMIRIYEENPMYVGTNKSGFFGAGVIFKHTAISDLAEQLGSDLYIMPSSAHEVIIVRTDSNEPWMLREMVREINDTELDPGDLLTYSVYRYTRTTDRITIV